MALRYSISPRSMISSDRLSVTCFHLAYNTISELTGVLKSYSVVLFERKNQPRNEYPGREGDVGVSAQEPFKTFCSCGGFTASSARQLNVTL